MRIWRAPLKGLMGSRSVKLLRDWTGLRRKKFGKIAEGEVRT
jgi:hypothetical protein